MSATAKGMWVALANLVVVAFAVACVDADRSEEIKEITIVVSFAALIPSLVIGAIVGGIAGRIADMSALARLALLAPLPLLLVVGLGGIGDHVRLIPWAFVPTAAAISILERWTRKRAAPPVPVAQASS